jgi:phosphopantetheine--protein transferase-like protein
MGRPIAPLGLKRLLGDACASAGAGAIVGVGVDVEPVASFERLAPGDPFLLRVFTEAERDYCHKGPAPAQRFAARFAAKEAVVKAVGAYAMLLPHDIEILRPASGAPVVRLREGCAAIRGAAVHISMGHTDTLGYAVAVATQEDA